jgi:parvulin-like peptidyl-prolyl isomerase
MFKIGEKIVNAEEIPKLLKRYQLMPHFLRGLIIDKAIENISCSEEEKRKALEQFLAQNQLTTPETQEAWLKERGLTIEELEEIAVMPLAVEKFKQAKWSNKVERYFLTRKSSLDRVVYSLIRTKNYNLARELYYRVLEGEQSFAEVASQYSEGPEAQTGGQLGPVALSQPHPAISKILSVSQPGQLWAPRGLAEWTVIIRLEKFIPAQLDDQMRQALINEMFETWLREETTKIGKLELVDRDVAEINS